MPALNFKKQDLPFLLAGSSSVRVETGDLPPAKKLDETVASAFDVGVSGSGGSETALGQSGTVNVKVSASASAKLTPVFATSKGAAAKLLGTYGLDGFFKAPANAGSVALVFETGASAEVSAAASFRFSALKAGATLDAGADAAYAYVKALDKQLKLLDLLGAYFKAMRLPEQAADRPLEAGEAIALKYGGYLKLGADASAGFQMSGSKDFSLGGLALSEKLDLSVIGRIGVAAEIAGHFSILMTPGDEPGWTAVRVRRQNAKSFSVAADVKAGVTTNLDLPPTADEFLGAALGVNAKNFLNVLRKAHELSDFEKFKQATDALARRFVGELIGKGFDKLEGNAEFTKFMATANRAVTSYDELDSRAIALFDRYFDRITVLTDFLDELVQLEQKSLATLRSKLTPELWNIFSQLTDGDPVGFLLPEVTIAGQPVDTAAELRKRAALVLALVRDEAHAEIRKVVTLAKTSFGIDIFFRQLAKVDTVEELEALANDKVGEFVTRLVGRTLDSSANIKDALARTKNVLDKLADFRENLFKALKDAANSSYKFSLHAGYSRASERDALIDVQIRADHPRGPEFLRLAGQGDFAQILTSRDTDLVRLGQGLFTHKTTREKAFKVTIVGWHLNWSYSGFDRVITEAEQRLVTSPNGITVLTTMDLEVERKRQRQAETVHVNFLLRALGESARVVPADARSTSFLVDVLTSLAASYRLDFTDDDTTQGELQDYLGFAAELGLDERGANLAELEPVLPRAPNGGFGSVKSEYTVRFGPEALKALLGVKITPAAEATIRTTMRQILLANYLKGGPALHDVAFAYATNNTFLVRAQQGAQFTDASSDRVFPVDIGNPAIKAPGTVALSRTERFLVDRLYRIESDFVDAIRELYAVLNSKKSFKPDAFEKKLSAFGSALQSFDAADQSTGRNQIGVNSIFAVFDALVRLGAQGAPANIAVLQLTSTAGGREVERLFMTDAAAAS